MPDFYNERVATLKQRTMELHEIAASYTSNEKSKAMEPPTRNTGLPSIHERTEEQIIHGEEDVEDENSASFVK